jgi:hypothetical protein
MRRGPWPKAGGRRIEVAQIPELLYQSLSWLARAVTSTSPDWRALLVWDESRLGKIGLAGDQHWPSGCMPSRDWSLKFNFEVPCIDINFKMQPVGAAANPGQTREQTSGTRSDSQISKKPVHRILWYQQNSDILISWCDVLVLLMLENSNIGESKIFKILYHLYILMWRQYQSFADLVVSPILLLLWDRIKQYDIINIILCFVNVAWSFDL